MKTIDNNNFRKLSTEELNATKGGYWVEIILPDGRKVRIRF